MRIYRYPIGWGDLFRVRSYSQWRQHIRNTAVHRQAIDQRCRSVEVCSSTIDCFSPICARAEESSLVRIRASTVEFSFISIRWWWWFVSSRCRTTERSPTAKIFEPIWATSSFHSPAFLCRSSVELAGPACCFFWSSIPSGRFSARSTWLSTTRERRVSTNISTNNYWSRTIGLPPGEWIAPLSPIIPRKNGNRLKNNTPWKTKDDSCSKANACRYPWHRFWTCHVWWSNINPSKVEWEFISTTTSRRQSSTSRDCWSMTFVVLF